MIVGKKVNKNLSKFSFKINFLELSTSLNNHSISFCCDTEFLSQTYVLNLHFMEEMKAEVFVHFSNSFLLSLKFEDIALQLKQP